MLFPNKSLCRLRHRVNLWENLTSWSSSKPEVHNIFQRCRRRTKTLSWITCMKIWWSLDCGSGDMPANRQTYKYVNRHAHHNSPLIYREKNNNSTRCKANPDCIPPGYSPSRLLIIVGQLIVCVQRSTCISCRTPPSAECHANSILWRVKTMKPTKISCHGNVPWGIEKLTQVVHLQL